MFLQDIQFRDQQFNLADELAILAMEIIILLLPFSLLTHKHLPSLKVLVYHPQFLSVPVKDMQVVECAAWM